MANWRTCRRVVVWAGLVCLAAGRAGGTQISIPDPPEPTAAELLAAAGVKDAKDAEALMKTAWRLAREAPWAIDGWPVLDHEREYRLVVEEFGRRWSEQDEGRDMPSAALWRQLKEEMLPKLSARRLADPSRQLDAILRQLGQVGKPEQLSLLLLIKARTSGGTWKAWAAALEILNRAEPAEVLDAKEVSLPPWHVMADLPAEKASAYALGMWRRLEKSNWGTESRPLAERIWIAWSIAESDPKLAFSILRPGLESRDPALRLMAGMGIARLSDGRVPFRLTAPPEQTKAEREKWLAGIAPHKPEASAFADPLDAPVIKARRSGGIDLWWLDAKGSVERKQEDVWPGITELLADGTALAHLPALGWGRAGLVDPDGQVLVRYEETAGQAEPAVHGGIIALRHDAREIAEYAADGSLLWAIPVSQSNAIARFAGRAGRGQALLIRNGVEIIDRRGDVVWSVRDGLDDPRWARMVGPDTVLVACKQEVQLRDRAKGLIHSVNGFKSALWVRYHPTKPWMIFDGGESAVVLYDPATKTKTPPLRVQWENDDPPTTSKWIGGNWRAPE